MPGKVNVGYFHIESYCFRSGAKAPDVVPLGSTGIEHVIEIANDSTLDYEFEVENTVPTTELEFEHDSNRDTMWTAEMAVAAGCVGTKAAKIICAATKSGTVVVDSSKLTYRQDANCNWHHENPAPSLKLAISIT